MPFPPPPPRSPMPAMDQIPGENVYIGGMFALREKTDMKAKAITHVLSVLRLPLDKSLFQDFEHLAIEVNDMEEENLIQHFAAANAFIEKAIASGGAVLIHCAMGKSRSATVLVAYLMRSRRIGVEEAVRLVREIRPFVEPNPGFIKQLEVYYEMGYTTDLEHPSYKRWLHQQELAQSIMAKRPPGRVHFRDSEKVAPEATQVKEGETPEQPGLAELRCKRCRHKLANSQFLVPHVAKPAQPPAPQTAAPTPCSHHFVEPLSWMKPELDRRQIEGKLDCPKCKAKKVGTYAWKGIMCSCGEWVVPGFSLARSKVDEVKARPDADTRQPYIERGR